MGDLTDLPREDRSRETFVALRVALQLKLKGHSCVPVKSGVFRKRRAFGIRYQKIGGTISWNPWIVLI